MALTNLHEMIRNLSQYIKSLEVLCDSGVTLAKNFERLLSPGPVPGPSIPAASLDSDVLTQSVATWEVAHKLATADANTFISELLPHLQETVQSVMKDPAAFHSSNTYEVFRSCFSAFFQIQWRFCTIYLQCSSASQSYSGSHGMGLLARSSPDGHALARSPTSGSFSSDRRESTESCLSSFSMPRSSISGLSSLSSRSTSPLHSHSHHYGHHHSRSRNSSVVESNSPSVKFTPSQPPSPLMPFGDGGYPYLFRRWSAHTHNFQNQGGSSLSTGSSTSSNLTGMGSFGSSNVVGFSTVGFNRRWSVPASAAHQATISSDSNKKSDPDLYEYGLLDAINLLSTKPHTPSTINESINEFHQVEQITSLWPPSEKMPGVVLTTCGVGDQDVLLESMEDESNQGSLRVPFGGSTESHSAPSSIMSSLGQTQMTMSQSIHHLGEYSLFGNSPSPTQSQGN